MPRLQNLFQNHPHHKIQKEDLWLLRHGDMWFSENKKEILEPYTSKFQMPEGLANDNVRTKISSTKTRCKFAGERA